MTFAFGRSCSSRRFSSSSKRVSAVNVRSSSKTLTRLDDFSLSSAEEEAPVGGRYGLTVVAGVGFDGGAACFVAAPPPESSHIFYGVP